MRQNRERPAVAGSRTQDTSGLYQCSAAEPHEPDIHQPSQSAIGIAQKVLNASVAYQAATQYVLSELRQERTHTEWQLKPEVSWL